MSNYKVPAGMTSSALEKYHEQVRGKNSSQWAMEPCLESALRWLAEHPIVPTHEQMSDLYTYVIESFGAEQWARTSEWNRALVLIEEWQRRMCVVKDDPALGAARQVVTRIGSNYVSDMTDTDLKAIINAIDEARKNPK